MNEIILNILKRKIISGEIAAEDIKSTEYKAAIIAWQETNT